MAKKTKKEKIMAEYHRKLESLAKPVYSLPKEKTEKSVLPLALRETKNDYHYVASDLRRILILAALAICAQVVLWYVRK